MTDRSLMATELRRAIKAVQGRNDSENLSRFVFGIQRNSPTETGRVPGRNIDLDYVVRPTEEDEQVQVSCTDWSIEMVNGEIKTNYTEICTIRVTASPRELIRAVDIIKTHQNIRRIMMS